MGRNDSDLRRALGGWRPGDRAYDEVVRRVQRRATRRRASVAVIAIMVFAVPFGLLLRSVGERHGVVTTASTSSPGSPNLLTYDGRVSEEALSTGILVAHDGCLFLRKGAGSEQLIAWPAGTSLGIDDEGLALVFDRQGRLLGREGDEITSVGGSLSSAEETGGAYGSLSELVPAACRTQEIWLVGSVH